MELAEIDKLGEFWAKAKWDGLTAMEALSLAKATGNLGKMLEKERKQCQSETLPTTPMSSPQESKVLSQSEEQPQNSKPEEPASQDASSLSSSTTESRSSSRGPRRR